MADFQALADVYSADNDRLKNDITEMHKEIDDLRARLDAASQQLIYLHTSNLEVAPEPEEEEAPEPGGLKEGDIIFYKKTHTTPKYDVLIRIRDCEHSNWQNGHAGEKARKGIERMEGRSLKSQLHCASCTGGGVWKVKW